MWCLAAGDLALCLGRRGPLSSEGNMLAWGTYGRASRTAEYGLFSAACLLTWWLARSFYFVCDENVWMFLDCLSLYHLKQKKSIFSHGLM